MKHLGVWRRSAGAELFGSAVVIKTQQIRAFFPNLCVKIKESAVAGRHFPLGLSHPKDRALHIGDINIISTHRAYLP